MSIKTSTNKVCGKSERQQRNEKRRKTEMEEEKQDNTHFTSYFLVVVKPQGVWLSIIQNTGKKQKKPTPKKTILPLALQLTPAQNFHRGKNPWDLIIFSSLNTQNCNLTASLNPKF